MEMHQLRSRYVPATAVDSVCIRTCKFYSERRGGGSSSPVTRSTLWYVFSVGYRRNSGTITISERVRGRRTWNSNSGSLRRSI